MTQETSSTRPAIFKKFKKRLHSSRGDTASPLKFYGERAGREKNMFEKVKKKEKNI